MKRKNSQNIKTLLFIFLAAALLSACAHSETPDKVIVSCQLKSEGISGSIDIEGIYSPVDATVSLRISNKTDYEMTIDDPVILYAKTIGETYEALYPPASGQGVYVGVQAVILPGKTGTVDVIPHSLKLKGGDYRINLSSLQLIDQKTGEICPQSFSKFMSFSIAE